MKPRQAPKRYILAHGCAMLAPWQAKYNSCLKDNAALRKLLEEGKEDQVR